LRNVRFRETAIRIGRLGGLIGKTGRRPRGPLIESVRLVRGLAPFAMTIRLLSTADNGATSSAVMCHGQRSQFRISRGLNPSAVIFAPRPLPPLEARCDYLRVDFAAFWATTCWYFSANSGLFNRTALSAAIVSMA